MSRCGFGGGVHYCNLCRTLVARGKVFHARIVEEQLAVVVGKEKVLAAALGDAVLVGWWRVGVDGSEG